MICLERRHVCVHAIWTRLMTRHQSRSYRMNANRSSFNTKITGCRKGWQVSYTVFIYDFILTVHKHIVYVFTNRLLVWCIRHTFRLTRLCRTSKLCTRLDRSKTLTTENKQYERTRFAHCLQAKALEKSTSHVGGSWITFWTFSSSYV